MSAEEELIARDGDVLVVSYPEVKVPLARFSIVSVGGLVYTRKLLKGDVVREQHDKIYVFLRNMAEREAREKIRIWSEELNGGKRNSPPLPPKPAGAGAQPAAAPVQPQPPAAAWPTRTRSAVKR